MDLPFAEGVELYLKAIEKQQDEYLWDMWLVRYQDMTAENNTSFEQFKVLSRTNSATKRTEDEVLNDAENILQLTRRS